MRHIVTDRVEWSVGLSVRHSSEPSYPAKNGWTDRDAVWVVESGGSKEACIRCSAHWHHLANTTELSMCDGHAAFLSNYFDHLLLLAINSLTKRAGAGYKITTCCRYTRIMKALNVGSIVYISAKCSNAATLGGAHGVGDMASERTTRGAYTYGELTSVIAIRSPFCAATLSYCVVIRIKFNQLVWENVGIIAILL